MTQQTSPWIESAYGWSFGESGWNIGMDQNLLKFSFMFDRNVDSITASLPPAVNGQAHFLTTDNRLYFAVGTTYFSSPVPSWFEFKIRSTGDTYQFNGTSAVQIDNPSEIDSRLDAVELTLSSLGTAAFQNVEDFATQAELAIVEGQAQSYTDVLRQDIASPAKGAAMVARGVVAVDSIADLLALPEGQRKEGLRYLVKGYHAGSDVGGGEFYWNPARASENDGGLVLNGFVRVHSGPVKLSMFGAHPSFPDNHAYAQAAFNASDSVVVDDNTVYKIGGTIVLTRAFQSLLGETLADYPTAVLEFTGNGTLFRVESVNTLSVIGVQLRGTVPTENTAYRAGTTCFDLKYGSTPIKVEKCWIRQFQILFDSNYNSFYNQFHMNRMERFERLLNNFSAYNLQFTGNRVRFFHEFARVSGIYGPFNVTGNSFEVFNGDLVYFTTQSGAQPSLNFIGNYVEDYYGEVLLAGMPDTGPRPGYFGSRYLFSGSSVGVLNISGNTLDVPAAHRWIYLNDFIASLSLTNNRVQLNAEGTDNLQYITTPTPLSDPRSKSVTIRGNTLSRLSRVGPFSTTYAPVNPGQFSSVAEWDVVDPITGRRVPLAARKVGLELVNGYVASADSSEAAPYLLRHSDGSISIGGTVNGSGRTSQVFATVPVEFRPTTPSGVTWARFAVVNSGGGTVVLRYIYGTGVLRLEDGAASYASVYLDGVTVQA